MPSFLARKHQKFHRKNRFLPSSFKVCKFKTIPAKSPIYRGMTTVEYKWHLVFYTSVCTYSIWGQDVNNTARQNMNECVFSRSFREHSKKKAATLCDPSCTHHQNKKGTVFMHSNHLSTDGGVEHDLVVFKNMISTLGTVRYYRRLLTREQHGRFSYEDYWKLTSMVMAQVQNVLVHFEIQFLKFNSQQQQK